MNNKISHEKGACFFTDPSLVRAIKDLKIPKLFKSMLTSHYSLQSLCRIHDESVYHLPHWVGLSRKTDV